MYDVVKGAGLFLTVEQWARLMDSCQQLFDHYNALTHCALQRQEQLYNIVFKHHATFHICHSARFINPAK
eukprot:7079966-Alexandrium_andersonii.AAC.1